MNRKIVRPKKVKTVVTFSGELAYSFNSKFSSDAEYKYNKQYYKIFDKNIVR